MDDYVEEPTPRNTTPPRYVAALMPYPAANGQSVIYIGALLVTGAVVEYLPEDNAVRLTDLGTRMGLALVNPEHFGHTSIANTLMKMNATDGRDPSSGMNVTRIVDTDKAVHPISYQTARQQVRSKHYL